IKKNITHGVIFCLLSGLTFSILSIFNRKLSKNHSSLLIAFYEDFFASLFLLPFFLLLKAKISSLYELTLLAILGIFCTAIAHSLFIKGMCYVQAQIASIVATLEPVYGIFLAFILVKETPSVRTLIGGLIIIFSAIGVSLRKK
ncbi:MAG: DMT family transporter, partial [Candidatus Aminicenantia bacterium]